MRLVCPALPAFASRFRLVLVVALLLSVSCADRKRISPVSPDEPQAWELGAVSVYPVPSQAGSVVVDSVSGRAFRFPAGGTATLSIAPILSGPAAPFAGQGLSVEYAGNDELQLLVDPASAARVIVLGYGRVDGAFNEPGERDHWVSVPLVDTLEGGVACLLTMPYTAARREYRGSAPGRAAGLAARPRGFSKYWISSIPAGSSLADSMVHIELQASTYTDEFLAALAPARRAAANAEIRGRMRLNYAYDGFYYNGFWWRSLGAHGRLLHPTVHYRTNANAGNVAHELGHYFTHVLVGDDVWSTLEGQAPLWDTGHGIRDLVGRGTLLEDYAYLAEYHLIGDVKGYDLQDPYVVFNGLSPLTADFPSLEGFGAVMLASLTRSDAHVRDLITGRLDPAPVLDLPWSDVYEVVAQRATDTNTLRGAIETRLGADAAKLPALLQRCGWRYSVRGRYVDAGGAGVTGVKTSAVSRVGETTYEGGFTTLGSATDGSFSVMGGVFGGHGELRATKGPDTAFVAIQIDWTQPTTGTVDVGNLTVAFPPVITGLSALSGRPGDAVTIAGRNFGAVQGNSTVAFGGVAAAVTSWGDAAIAVRVPTGARTGVITVTRGAVVSNGAYFTVTGAGYWVLDPVEVHDQPVHNSDWCNYMDIRATGASFAQHCGYDNPYFEQPHALDWETRVTGTWTELPAALFPGDSLTITITIHTEYVRADDPPTRSPLSIGFIRLGSYGMDGTSQPDLEGSGTQTTTHYVRPVSPDPGQDGLYLSISAGGYAGAGTVERAYTYRWRE